MTVLIGSFYREVRRYFSRFLAVFCIMLTSNSLFAQEMLGIVNSSYAGISGVVINPAVTVTSPFYLDINLVTANIFAENNYVYLAKEDYRFSRFFSKNPVFPTHGVNNNQVVYDYFTKKDKNAYASVRLLGPSVAVTVGRHSFGLVTGARAVMSTKNVPYEMAKFAFEQLNYPPQNGNHYIDSRNIYNAELAWAENGLNYSYILKQESFDYWAAGITVKDLRGYGGGYLYTTNVDYSVFAGDTLVINNMNGKGGYSLPLNYETNDFERNPLFRGKGFGFDIGVIYQKKKSKVENNPIGKLCSQKYSPYQYKIGISLIDIGRVKFTQNAEEIIFDNVSTNWYDVTNTHFGSIRNFTDVLSNQFYGNPTQLIQGNEITIALPTALSIQADMNYYKNWYINGTLVYPVQFSKSGLIRPAILALTPRFETYLFEASLPISLYDWTKPRIGFSARFMGFFIGTEKISGFFNYKNFTGIDFYFGLKISLRKGFCRSKSVVNCGIEEFRLFSKKSSE